MKKSFQFLSAPKRSNPNFFSPAWVLGVFVATFLFFKPVLAFEVSASEIYLNDPGFTTNAQDVDKSWGLIKAGFYGAWDKTTGSENVVVAIIDTGVDATHEDLRNIKLVPGINLLENKPIEGNVNSDDNGHGTLIAGILGATPGNSRGVVGTNWKISIMPIKALNAAGTGDSGDIARGIIWAVDNGAQIINLSLGGISFGHDRALSEAIAYAFKKNVIIVAAAGNDSSATGLNLDEGPVFPICEDNDSNMVIGVTAVDQNDLKPNFANFGKNCIDVAAPGKRILSTINHDPLTKAAAPNSYAYASGTSLAVPFVSGEAALLKALFPFASNTQIRDQIIATADPIDQQNLYQCGGKSCKGLLGSGRINVKAATEYAIADQSILEGDLVRVQEGGMVYLISGGKKHLVSSFVYNQRFLGTAIKNVPESRLSQFAEGNYALPKEDTLVKLESDPTVYAIKNGKKEPVLGAVFKQRGYKFSDINVVSFTEFNSWITGSFMAPAEGTIMKAKTGGKMYWVVGETLHEIDKKFIKAKGIGGFPQLVVANKDINGFSKGDKWY